MTSRYIEIRPDNIPSNGKISFKNGFPVLSFTISAQDGLLDPASIRIVGSFSAFSDNLQPTPTPLLAGDNVTMSNRLGIYNVFESLTVRAVKSKMITESIRHYSKFMNSYLSMTSSLQDQMGHFGQTALICPNSKTFRQSVMESTGAAAPRSNSFSAHIPCGFVQSGQMINLRPDAFGGVQIEFLLQPDANVLYSETGVATGVTESHYELSDLKLTCEVSDIPAGDLAGNESTGVYEFNTVTSLYTSINSTNAQIQYSLALRNVLSAFLTFMPVTNINTLTADGQATTYPSGTGPTTIDALAPIRRVSFLKGGTKYPSEFDYVNNVENDTSTAEMTLPDPQILYSFKEAITPEYSHDRFSVSPVNANRSYNMATTTTDPQSYNVVADGGAVMGLGVKYGLGGAGEDFSQEQWGVSIESDLKADNPMGVYIFVKSRTQVAFSPNGVQIVQ